MKPTKRFFSWLRQWWWVLFLTALVTVSVSGAYILSDNSSPLDAVSGGASLLLTIFLVYIYSQQNELLKRQEEILESQYEIQKETEMTPELEVRDVSFDNSVQNLQVEMKNVRDGDAYNISFQVETKIIQPTSEFGAHGSKWSDKKQYHIAGYEDETISGSINFSIETVANRETSYQGWLDYIYKKWGKHPTGNIETHSNFVDLSTDIVQKAREEGHGSPITLGLSMNILYEDSAGEQYSEELKSESFEIDGSTELHCSGNSLMARGLYPDLEFSDISLANENKLWNQISGAEFAFMIENTGSVNAKISDIRSRCSIVTDGREAPIEVAFSNGLVDMVSSDLSFSGVSLDRLSHQAQKEYGTISPDTDDIFIVPYLFSWKSNVGSSTENVWEIVDQINDPDLLQALEWSLKVTYADEAGNTYSSIEFVTDLLDI